MSIATFLKDPDAVVERGIDWTLWLGVDTIVTSTWVADTGLTIDSDANTTTLATVVLSGGTAGVDYTVTNHITTGNGFEDDRSVTIKVRER